MTNQVDRKVESPIDPFDWDSVVKVTCHWNCSYQRHCVLDAYVKDGVVLRVEPSAEYPPPKDPEVPDWSPRGCQKGLVSVHRMYDPSRLRYPLKRVGERGGGKWQQISWDEAFTEISDAMIDVMTTDGADTMVRFGGSGGTMASESLSYETLMSILGIPMGTGGTELGDEHQGAALVFGQSYVAGSVDNYYLADIILIWGGNPAYTNIPNFHFITEARYKGTKVVTISPDYSASAIQADLWVPVNIGTDAALALSMAQVIVQKKLYKADFIREQTDLPLLVREDNRKFLRQKDLRRDGRDDIYYYWDSREQKVAEAPWQSLALGEAVPALEGEYEVATVRGRVKVRPVFELLKQRLEDYTPEKASQVTGVSPSLIEQLAEDIARARGVVNVSTFNWGKYYNGDEIERSIILVFALCGHMGRKGAMYNAWTQLGTDTSVGGIGLRGRMVLSVAAANDPRYATWKSQGYTDEMIMMEYARDNVAKGGIMISTLFHYLHSGVLELNKAHNNWDPSLKRPIDEYVKEAIDKGWQFVTPKPGREPRVMINEGGSFLRRGRATNQIIKTLLPKLKLFVVIDTRMTSTALYADYVLPAAGHFEKFSFQGLGKPEFPLAFLINRAVDPLYESKTEWEIGCLWAKKLEERAKARGVTSINTLDGKQIRLNNLYDRVTMHGMYWEQDDEAVARDFYLNAVNLEQIPWEELKERGFVAGTGIGLTHSSIGNACDIVPGEPVVPLTWHIVKKEPYPTQTRRMQFYIDHDVYLEFGVELPAQLKDPKAGGDYPLRLTGGHARWSIHSSQVDDAILLRLQRGGPVIWLNADDAQARGIEDGDMVEVHNDVASFSLVAVVSPQVKPGQTIVYHAWENFQFPGWKHFKSVMPCPLNPIELAGGYYHVRPAPWAFTPGFSDRDTRIEVSKVRD